MNQTAIFFTRAANSHWQDKMRASVRLYLVLGANPAAEQMLDALLQHTEQELLDYLLAGPSPSPGAREQAQQFLDAAQRQLLDSPVEVRGLLAGAAGGFAQGELAPMAGQDNSPTASWQFGHEQHLAVGVPFLHDRAQTQVAGYAHCPTVGGGVVNRHTAELESGHSHTIVHREDIAHNKERIELQLLNRQRWQAYKW